MLELSGPVIMSLEINNECSVGQCPGCPKHFDVKGDEMSITEWEKVIGKLDKYVQEFRISGGEPMNHPKLFEILGILEKTKKYYHIFTDGVWDDTDHVLEELSKLAHVSSITFSLHGHNRETHGAFTGCSDEETFEKVLDNIHMTYAAGHNVNTNTVLHKKNLEHIEEIADLSVELGSKFSVFSRYIGPDREDLNITPDELKKAGDTVNELKDLGYNTILGNCIPYCHIPSSTSGCFAGITFASLDKAGNLRPCSYSSIIAGNLLKEDVKKVWRSSVMKKWRSRISKDCKDCSKIALCPGGCKCIADFLEQPADPLISGPVLNPDKPAVLDVTLEEDLCPKPRYITRREDFGWILIHGNQVIPVSHRAEKILKSLDGSSTLGDIQEKFGAGALSFIYSLYVRDFIEFRVRNEEEE